MKRIVLFGMSLIGFILLTTGGYETVKSVHSIQYLDIIRAIKKRYGFEHVPDELTLATIETESSFIPDEGRFEYESQPGVFNDGSFGLMQVLYSTAVWLGFKGDPEGLFDPETNIRYGTAYQSYLYKKYKDWDAVIHAYNEGEGNYDKGRRVPTYYARVKARWSKWATLLIASGDTA